MQPRQEQCLWFMYLSLTVSGFVRLVEMVEGCEMVFTRDWTRCDKCTFGLLVLRMSEETCRLRKCQAALLIW